MKQLEQQNKRQEELKQQEIDDAKALAQKLEEIEVEIPAKTGEGGKLFGSVSTKQITQALEKQHQIKVDKRKMDLPNGIHSLGYTKVSIKLHNKVSGTLKVHVVEA